MWFQKRRTKILDKGAKACAINFKTFFWKMVIKEPDLNFNRKKLLVLVYGRLQV